MIAPGPGNLDKVCSQSALWSVSIKDNPSLELEDGSRQLLVLNNHIFTTSEGALNTPDSLITESGYLMKCNAGIPTVYAPTAFWI